MSITDKKITSWTNPITGEADTPNRTASAMKAVFDSNSNQLKASLNGLADELVATTAAAQIGSEAITGVNGTTVRDQIVGMKTYVDDKLIVMGEEVSVNGKQGKNITLDSDDIGSAFAPVEYTALLALDGWSASAPYTQTVAVAGILATDRPIVDVALTGTTSLDYQILEAWSMVTRIETAAGSITATCLNDKPTFAIPIHMEVIR